MSPSPVPSILVVDDNAGLADVVRRVLERDGHEVRVAVTGLEGARRHQEQATDLAIVDIHMPGMNGLELLVHLKTIAPRMPVIVMSGGVQTGSLNLLADARLLGAFATLAKPFSVDELLSAVARALATGPRADASNGPSGAG